MAKPDGELEALAGEVVTTLRSTLEGLRNDFRKWHGTGASPAAPPYDSIERARTGHFLSARMATDLDVALEPGHAANFAGDLAELIATPAETVTLRELVAYFLKYRYLELTDFAVPPDGRRAGPADLRWRPVEWPNEPRLATSQELAKTVVDRVRSAPWLGSLPDSQVRTGVTWLVDLGFLEFAEDTDLRANHRPESGIATLRVRPTGVLADEDLADRVRAVLARTVAAERERADLVTDLGVGLGAVGPYETYQLIEEAGRNDVIKLATYHSRTSIGKVHIEQWLRRNPDLRIQILCLGPTTVDSLTEGAAERSLTASLADGVQSFNRTWADLGRRRKQVRVRIYGDIESQALFRGSILCAANGVPKRILATTWPYGVSRANYGEILKLEGSSNLARLLVDYYDRAWKESVPLISSALRDWSAWLFRGITAEIWIAGLVALLSGAYLFVRNSADGYFGILAVLPVIVTAAVRIGKRINRAIRLSRGMRRSSREGTMLS